ncbi:acyl-CoA carboxylase subunit epsilon [Micromonospora olivasterospora]|uniref:Acyl-CoA carboxylase epsilon subunit-like protein n=1 Tax=Micromonospora olivasterospora TaxID=1880 RepID=A0A562IJT8_MICOL|nr:acyl-CoA carboxylase subunit epsilon [Micromonospora olivasterospora]TWH70963.1 acyl-CoA carboxylase epsilon subunit-like protein [Micromonospora olivasterospora]
MGTDLQRDAASARPIALVRGGATPEELAIVMVVLARAACSTTANDLTPRRTSVWAERARLARQPLAHAPGAWRSLALPR